ncbi:hypothetical protein D3C71_1615770 [compost metagenome]
MSKDTTVTVGTAFLMFTSIELPLAVDTRLPARSATSLMPLPALTSTFWPATNVVSEKSICASRSLLCVRDAASRSMWPCCNSGMRAASVICLNTGLTPSLAATALPRSTS